MTQLITDAVSTCHPGFELNILCRSRLKMSYTCTAAQQTDSLLHSEEMDGWMHGWNLLFKHGALSDLNIHVKIWLP